MTEKARRLGRGLDFLLPAQSPSTPTSGQQQIELDRITSNPWQPRSTFDPASMNSLADSIRQHGVIQPITVRPQGAAFQLVAGERRLIAARSAGLSTIPAIIRELTDDEMLLVALIENVQRQDLNPIERARALKRLVEQHARSQEDVAALAGIARSTVSNSMRLLELDDESIAALSDGRITEGHARALLAEPDVEKRRRLLHDIFDNKMNVRQVEKEITISRKTRRPASDSPSADSKRLGKLLSEHLKTRTDIVERGQSGRIVIRYGTLKEFERLYQALTGTRPPDE